jgi:hypothetical protein
MEELEAKEEGAVAFEATSRDPLRCRLCEVTHHCPYDGTVVSFYETATSEWWGVMRAAGLTYMQRGKSDDGSKLLFGEAQVFSLAGALNRKHQETHKRWLERRKVFGFEKL